MVLRLRPWPLAAAGALTMCVGVVQTAGNSVPATKLDDNTIVITPDTLKPTSCAAITLTAKLSGSGTISGSTAAELITGGAAVDMMWGNAGNDCLVGGAGNDTLIGGSGTDVCIGGLGTDRFNASCETRIQ